MIQYRLGVFETNSSSSHSIVIRKQEPKLTVLTAKERDYGGDYGYVSNGLLHIHESDFGWGFGVLYRWVDRLAYAMASLCKTGNEIRKLLDSVLDEHPEVTGLRIYGYEDGKITSSGYKGGWGSIDHQSEGILASFLEEKGILPAEFVNDDRYIVIIDNDNTCTFADLVNCGLINKDAIAESF